MFRNEHDYYRHREQQERQMARNAADPAARALHRLMADHYAALGERRPA